MFTKKIKLDQEEQEILEAIEDNNIVSVGVDDSEIKELKEIAKNTFAKTKTISIRISARDLLKIKSLAAKEGIPYQTYIASTLHKIKK